MSRAATRYVSPAKNDFGGVAMSYGVAAPQLLVSAATDLETIGATMSAANAAAAAPTPGMLAARVDECRQQ
jgi:PE family